MEWSPTSRHVLAFADGPKPVAHIGFDEFDILLDDKKTSVIGIGGVVVRPEYQGRRIPALLFDALHAHAPEKMNSRMYALFCPPRLVAYYDKFGYVPHRGQVWYLQQGVETRSTFEFMYRGDGGPMTAVKIPSNPW